MFLKHCIHLGNSNLAEKEPAAILISIRRSVFSQFFGNDCFGHCFVFSGDGIPLPDPETRNSNGVLVCFFFRFLVYLNSPRE